MGAEGNIKEGVERWRDGGRREEGGGGGGEGGGSARPTAESRVIITALARSIVRPNPAQPVSIHPRLRPLSASWGRQGGSGGGGECERVKEGTIWRQETVEERERHT